MIDKTTPNEFESSCKICASLSDHEYATQKYGWEESNTYLPAASNQLVIVKDFQPFSSRKKQIQQCPECGTYYLYLTDYEYLVNGSEDEESLIRLPIDQAEDMLRE